MADYCDILRSHGSQDTLGIEVVRFDTQEMLKGQLNGRQLEQAYSFAQELGGEVGGSATDSVTYSDFQNVTDDAGTISVGVPSEWVDVKGLPWEWGENHETV